MGFRTILIPLHWLAQQRLTIFVVYVFTNSNWTLIYGFFHNSVFTDLPNSVYNPNPIPDVKSKLRKINGINSGFSPDTHPILIDQSLCKFWIKLLITNQCSLSNLNQGYRLWTNVLLPTVSISIICVFNF